VADAPLAKLVRVLGGVALGYGALGHQVLGQLITLNSKEVELAAAATLIAATSRQPNAGIVAAVRVLGPAVAVHLITRREVRRLELVWQRLEEKEQRLASREAALEPGRLVSKTNRPARGRGRRPT
jgi:hypothetical protein